MMVKKGISICGLRPELLFGMMIANEVFENMDELLVITEVVARRSQTWSYHPAGFAFDCRLPEEENVDVLGAVLRESLGEEWDVVVENNHIHVEYEVRRAHR